MEEMEAAHDCEKCHGKISAISIDYVEITRCEYCGMQVRYPTATKEEVLSWAVEK